MSEIGFGSALIIFWSVRFEQENVHVQAENLVAESLAKMEITEVFIVVFFVCLQ